jgi:putative DNA methylase
MTYKKKLIEVALPLSDISNSAASEKTIKSGHPANLHLWWARRPLVAARAVLLASLIDDPSECPDEFPTLESQRIERERLLKLISKFTEWNETSNEDLLASLKHEIRKSCDGELPKILDPFGGGGAIPLEALRLGLPSFSGDLNPVPIMIQRAMLQAIPRFSSCAPVSSSDNRFFNIASNGSGLASDVLSYGKMLIERVEKKLKHVYPSVLNSDGSKQVPVAWIWARTVRSPDPAWSEHVPLVKSWILAKKQGREVVHVNPIVDLKSKKIRYEVSVGGAVHSPTAARGGGTCLATGTPISDSYIKSEAIAGRMGHSLIAIACEGKKGRIYVEPTDEQEAAALIATPSWVPDGPMSDHSQYMGTPRYGMDEWKKLFTSRQLVALTNFVDELEEVREKIQADFESRSSIRDERSFSLGGAGALAYSQAISLFLVFAIDKLADLNNSLARWEPVAQCPRQLFGRQAIQMTWDYAEANPFSDSSGSMKVILDGISKAIRGNGFAGLTAAECVVRQKDAAAMIRGVGRCVVSTDPPYYDNIPYADLSDFFYVWMRPALKQIFPDEFATLAVPKMEELVADVKRHGGRENAQLHFESGMFEVFNSLAQNYDERYPASIFYAFKASESESEGNVSTGWETFLSGLLNAGFSVTATWPIRTENKTRLRGLGSNALASSIVLACRKRSAGASMATRGEFISALRIEMAPAIRILQDENIAPVDMAQSAIGPGIGIFSRYSKVIEADGRPMSVRTALSLINEVLAEILSGEESDFDADTRFAVTWFEQFGHNPGAFGDADTLAKAKNTTVTGVVNAGLADSKEGKVRLLERDELVENWNPVSDSRLTVWETTQNLIRALERTESVAAELLRQIGSGYGEKARQLAYLLYGICDRKKWASEAGAYNMLITAWPEIEKLARQKLSVDSSQETLF